MALGSTQTLIEMSTRNISLGAGGGGVKAAGPRADNLATFMSRFSGNLGASTAWNLEGL